MTGRILRVARMAVATAGLVLAVTGCRAESPSPFVLDRRIELPGVSGRIDHLALDAARNRLFVAALGNGSVEAVDLDSGRTTGRIGGLREPQGLGYVPGLDLLAVATGGDGMLRFYRAADLSPVGALKLGDDADDVRFALGAEGQAGELVVGYGQALAIVDPVRRSLVRSIPLPAHPEGFEVSGARAYVNLPGANGIGVYDLGSGRELARWPNPAAFNFPLALDPGAGLVASVYRLPGRVALFDIRTGRVVQQLKACGDADDAFFDPPRGRLYVVCGQGEVRVFQRRAGAWANEGGIPTRPGARTGLFDAGRGRLLVAERAAGAEPAAVVVLVPR